MKTSKYILLWYILKHNFTPFRCMYAFVAKYYLLEKCLQLNVNSFSCCSQMLSEDSGDSDAEDFIIYVNINKNNPTANKKNFKLTSLVFIYQIIM